jgi:hypothetical protein
MFKRDAILPFWRDARWMTVANYGILLSILALATAGFAAAHVPKPAAASPQFSDASGMYSFEREGEFVQINIEQPTAKRDAIKPLTVTGFISRYADTDSDRGAFLDYFISKGSLDGDKITFATKTVHGIFYEFTGTVVRGAAATKDKDGYYELRGTLTQNIVLQDKLVSPRSREITMKLFPDIDNATPKK